MGELRFGAASRLAVLRRGLAVSLVASLCGPVAGTQPTEPPTVHTPAPALEEVAEVTLRWVVKNRCQVSLCLLSIEHQPIGQEILTRLKEVGRVEAASSDDFVFEEGAVRGFTRRKGRIVDVRKLTVVDPSTVVVEVGFLATGMSSGTCEYRLQRSADSWAVDDKRTACTL